MDINFRSVTTDDLAILTELRREFNAFEPFPRPLDDETQTGVLRELIEHKTAGRIWLIEFENATVGYVVLTFGYSLEYAGRDALVDELYLRETWRGLGLGQAAMQFIADFCRAENIRAVHLEVEHDNTTAQNLYRKSGFAAHERYFLTKWID